MRLDGRAQRSRSTVGLYARGVSVAISEEVSTRRSSVSLYLVGFIVLGMCLSFSGPALAHLRDRSHVSIRVSGLVLGVQAGGYIVASLIAGRFFDRGHGHRLWAGACVVVAAAVVAITFVSWFPLVLVLFVVTGAAGAVMDVGGNTLVVWSRSGDQVGSTLNALHLCFGIGALSTPLLVSRSLVWSDDLRWFAGLLGIVALALAAALARADEPVHRRTEHHESTSASRRGMLGLVCIFFFLYVGLEAGFAGWVSTYAEEIELGGVGTAGVLTTVFWSGFTAGRIVAIWVSRRVSAVTMLVGSCVAASVAIGSLAVGHGATSLVWVATAVFGVTIGPQFPTMIAYSDERLRLSGSATSMIIASAGVGGLLLPVGIGWLFDRYGATAMPWTVAVACVVTTALAVVIVTVASARLVTARR